MTTLTAPSYQIILRSEDGTGSNSQVTFTLDFSDILSNSFTQYNVRSKFQSKAGPFAGSFAEVRWSLSNANQYDTRSLAAGTTVCMPKIAWETSLTGELVGGVLMSDFADTPPLLVGVPSTETLDIFVLDANGLPIVSMTSWQLMLVFEPVVARPPPRPTRRR